MPTFRTETMKPDSVYNGELKVTAYDDKGQAMGSSYVKNDAEAAEWFATLVEAKMGGESTPEADDDSDDE